MFLVVCEIKLHERTLDVILFCLYSNFRLMRNFIIMTMVFFSVTYGQNEKAKLDWKNWLVKVYTHITKSDI